MTRVSILFPKQRDVLSKNNCLCIELKGFLSNPRLCDDVYANDFGPSGYVGPAILVVEDHDASNGDLESSITQLLHPGRDGVFPANMVDTLTVKADCQIPQYTSHDSGDIWSIIKYRGGYGSLREGQSWLEDDRNSDLTKILRRQSRLLRSNTRVATWISTDTRVFRPIRKVNLTKFVVLMFEKQARSKSADTFAEILHDLFNSDSGLAEAIEDHPMLIYLYMHQCFNDFNNILKCYEGLFKLSNTITGRTTWGVSDRSFLLNQALIQISFSLPDILQNRALLKRLKEYNEDPPIRTRGVALRQGVRDAIEQAETTLSSIEDDVNDFERQVDMFLERFKASLELEFSVADERMSWVMMWFTFVAIIFTPMAFVASIFGMTSLEADPKWFAVAIVPVFLSSCGLCYYIFTKSQRLDDGLRPKKLQTLLHLMPYAQMTGLKRRKAPSSHKKSGWKTKQSRKHSHHHGHRPSAEARYSDLDDESGSGSDSSGPPHRPSGRPPIYVSVPPPPPSVPPGEPGIHLRPPAMFPAPPPPPPPGLHSSKPPMGAPSYIVPQRYSSKPHRMAGSHHQKPGAGKGGRESTTVYTNLRMPDFSSRSSYARKPSGPPRSPERRRPPEKPYMSDYSESE